MTLDHPPLTHDERKAAEAAFQDRPFNPMWSQKAQRIYDGIRAAQANRLANSQDSSVGLSLPSTNPSVPFHLHYSESAPFVPRIAQAWILEYQDTKGAPPGSVSRCYVDRANPEGLSPASSRPFVHDPDG